MLKMAITMHIMVLPITKHVIQKVRFITLNCDETTIVDNWSWISIHYYLVENFKKVPILLKLQRVTKGGGFNNLTTMPVNPMALAMKATVIV
jgi:hypothetical protein